MTLTLHKEHKRLLKERQERIRRETDFLEKYTPDQLSDIFSIDLYFLLNIQEYRDIHVPESVLFTRYRERIARYHPNYHDNRIFMALRNAYEIMKSNYWKQNMINFSLSL